MCLFCDIVSGSMTAEVILEDELTLGFLDIRPVFPGHTLLIPKEHHDTLLDLPDALLAPLLANARRLARAMEEGLDAAGSFVAMNNKISQSVPHLHIHIVPRRPKDGLRGFFWPRTHYDGEQHVREVADKLRVALS